MGNPESAHQCSLAYMRRGTSLLQQDSRQVFGNDARRQERLKHISCIIFPRLFRLFAVCGRRHRCRHLGNVNVNARLHTCDLIFIYLSEPSIHPLLETEVCLEELSEARVHLCSAPSGGQWHLPEHKLSSFGAHEASLEGHLQLVSRRCQRRSELLI